MKDRGSVVLVLYNTIQLRFAKAVPVYSESIPYFSEQCNIVYYSLVQGSSNDNTVHVKVMYLTGQYSSSAV